MITKRVLRHIEKENLFSPEDKILVALSGGADSVALLHLLHNAGYHCEAAHCNFHLRGEESDRDELFVHELCKKIGIKLHTVHFDTIQYASHKQISIEMAARELRYEWFDKIKETSHAHVVAVAHHKDDSIETILLNLIRGTGIAGLLGIRPRNAAIVRPLLCVNREEIIEYLASIGQTYVTDSTNLQNEYTRNKIRLDLIPIMQEINPSVIESILETGNNLNDVASIYYKEIAEGKKRVQTSKGIHIGNLLNEAAPRALLFEILHPLGFNPRQIKDVLTAATDGQPGKQFISKSYRVIRDREFLLLKPIEAETDLPSFELIREEYAYTSDFLIPRDKYTACFDADKLNQTIHIRKWQLGDTFIPFGMQGRKKVSDYMTDRKYSISQKEDQWILCCGDQIAWLIGERTDNRFRIDKTTRRVIIYKLKQ